jgi:hypothetical protein
LPSGHDFSVVEQVDEAFGDRLECELVSHCVLLRP